MPTTKRRLHSGLMQRLLDEPHRFEFFQAVRLLLSHHRQHSNDNDLDALGQVVRFRSSISLAFPPSEIESLEIEWDDADMAGAEAGGEPARSGASIRSVTLTPAFIGLTGPSGVLPRHYTQHAAEREIYHRDSATRAFLDIFASRAIALFYQSWLKYRLHFQYEADRNQRFLPLVLSLAGIGLPGTHERLADADDGMADESLAHYAGALRNRPQSAEWFSRVVSDYFGVRCKVEQFVGQWFELPDQERMHLGQSNCALGQSSFCGARVWDRQSKVRLTLGPLRRRQFDEFLPNGTASHSLRRLFRLMVGVVFDCEVRLILDKRDVRTTSLASRDAGARLGWDALCTTGASITDSHDTAYLIAAAGSD